MSLDDMISQNRKKDHNRGGGGGQRGRGAFRGRGAHPGGKQSHGNFNQNTGQAQQQFKRTPFVRLTSTWEAQADGGEIFTLSVEKDSLLKIASSGDVTVLAAIYRRDKRRFVALKAGLAAVGLKVSFDGDIEGVWTLSMNDQTWSKPLESDITVSAFPRRSWMSIRSQLQALPETMPLSAPKQEATGMPPNMSMLASNPAAAMAMMNPMMAIPFMLMAQQAAAMGSMGPMGYMPSGQGASSNEESRFPKAPMVLGGPPSGDSYNNSSGRPSSAGYQQYARGRGSHSGRGRR